MKKLALFFVTAAMIVGMAVTALASPSYSEWYFEQFNTWPDGTVLDWQYDPVYWEYLDIYDPAEAARLRNGQNERRYGTMAWINSAYWSGTTAKWTTEGYSEKFQVKLYRDDTSIVTKTVTKSSYDFSSYITRSGYYSFEVRPYDSYYGGWGEWESSADKHFSGSSGSSSGSVSPSKVTNGWVSTPGGGWQYYESGNMVKNRWVSYANNWYWMDAKGNMATGWQWINRLCYYLYPSTGGPIPQGACWMNGVTPDGYTVDATGAWTVNGVVQVQ